MKPKSFRHLTARSRKRVLRRLCRQWQDTANDVEYWNSEWREQVAEEDWPAAIAAFEERKRQYDKLAQLEYQLS